MKAEVLKDISPEIKKGDVLHKQGDLYVKDGKMPMEVRHEISGRFFWMKKIIAMSDNFVLAEHVENMPSWFKLIEK